MSSFVYIVRNLLDGKLYVGASKGDLHRLDEHRMGVKSNEHLQNAIKLYGIENFAFEQLEEWPTYERALEAEGEIVSYLKSIGCILYNKCDGGRGCSNPTPEVRLKMSIAKRGERSPRWGKKDSEETKAKRNAAVSKTMTGRKTGPHSAEWNANISAGNKGIPHVVTPKSIAAYRRQSERLKGKPMPWRGLPVWNKGRKTGPMDPSVVAKRAASQRGLKRSDATKERQRIAAIRREAIKRFRAASHAWFMTLRKSSASSAPALGAGSECPRRR